MGHVDDIAGGSDRRHAHAAGGFLRFLHRRSTDQHGLSDDVRAVLDAMPLPLLLVDDAGRVDMVSTDAARLLGRPVESLVDRDIEHVLPGLSNGREHIAMRADGSRSSLGAQATDLHLHGREWRLVFLTDVGERQRKEAESARQRDEVAHLSRVAMLGELSGALAHELNQPLAAILCNAQAAQRLLRRVDDAEGDVVLDEAGTMLRDILDDIVSDDRRAPGATRPARPRRPRAAPARRVPCAATGAGAG